MKRYIFFFCLTFVFLSSFINASDVAVVTLAVGQQYQKTVALGIDNKRLYCEKQGYDFICGTESLDTSRPIPWSKVQLILKVMDNPSYKWIFWTDADSLVMNLARRVEDLIDEKYDLIISKDIHVINSGQFLIKNCKSSRDFLEKVYGHVEFIHHPWWENQAILVELEQNSEFRALTKVIPQRLINSYPEEIIGSRLTHSYKKGDFIVHFAGEHDRKRLAMSMNQYARRVIDDPQTFSLDYFLQVYGFQLSPLHSNINEGYMTDSQKEQFTVCLKKYTNIRSILEIGLNAGHSADNFLQVCKEVDKFVSFDLNTHPYTAATIEYFSRKNKDSFEFIEGDSIKKIPEYANLFPEQKFDLIYIDGNHTYEYCLADIMNCYALAHSSTILWVDDYVAGVKEAVEACQRMGIIEILNIHLSHDPCGGRIWVEARYIK